MKEATLDPARGGRVETRDVPNDPPPAAVAARLDLAGVRCPRTFVRTMIRLETLAAGEVLEVRLTDRQGIADLARSIRLEGHRIVGRRGGSTDATFWIERGEDHA